MITIKKIAVVVGGHCCWTTTLLILMTLFLSAQANNNGCCSWDLKTCQQGGSFCVRPDRCAACNMYWITTPNDDSSCLPRTRPGCDTDDDCCDGLACLTDETGGIVRKRCNLPHCCSLDIETGECMRSARCNHSQDRCLQCNANAVWIDRRTYEEEHCLARGSPCSLNSQCCQDAKMKCILMEQDSQTPVCEYENENDNDYGVDYGVDRENRDECCSWNLRDCLPPQQYCSLNEYTCDACNMFWIRRRRGRDQERCIPRMVGGCRSDADCCNDDSSDNPLVCLDSAGNNFDACDFAFCCSNNLKDCSEREYCNFSPDHCRECEEGGIWIERKWHPNNCTARADSCESDDECCGSLMTCREIGDSRVCALADDNEEEDDSNQDSITDEIISKPSERVVLPQPPLPEDLFEQPQSHCPHLDNGLWDWHDGWWPGGRRPSDGQDVTLPLNRRVVVRRTVRERLGVVIIPSSSELILSPGVSFDVRGIDVVGRFTAGSETCRLQQSTTTITLHGSRTSTDNNWTYKGISVTGTLNLHGKRYFPTWTRLAKTVRVGDTEVWLQNANVNWEPGQQIVLVTTALKDSRDWHRNEVVVIRSVEYNTTASDDDMGYTIVHLQTPAQYQHVAAAAYQGEVGLLSRSIVIQGAPDDSEPTDPDLGNCTSTISYWGDDNSVPCPDKELTGFGGHIVVHGNGRGHVQGVELYRMGQTNVLGKYPMHFHLLGECPECYFRDSSIHRSYYRCVSIHGTHRSQISENVAYDVIGFCYYLEDGIEEENEIKFNLAAHIHFIKSPPGGGNHYVETVYESEDLLLPADVAASGYYITNVNNIIVGNAASGGWACFAFPVLPTPLQFSRDVPFRPASATSLLIDGNTAHSCGWWWQHAGGFYIGGILKYNNNDILEYNPGRSNDRVDQRNPCLVNPCIDGGDCQSCSQEDWLRITNSKAFLIPGAAMNSWAGELEVIGFEAHDVGLSVDAISRGFWLNNMLMECRTGMQVAMPEGTLRTEMQGTGFFWYDTVQEHIITDTTFRNCGYRSYNESGCGGNAESGCDSRSAVFRFLTFADEFSPEVMQATRNITFENCGRKFSLENQWGLVTVGGRGQSIIDVDGTLSELNEPVLVGSGLEGVTDWWSVDDQVVYEPEGPLIFVKKNNGPERAIGHVELFWDDSIHNQVGRGSYCGDDGISNCPALGYMHHMGRMFTPTNGMPITANAEVVGPTGGFGWIMKLNRGAPRTLHIRGIEVDPDSPLLLSIAYPPGTTFTLTAYAARSCRYVPGQYTCREEFTAVSSIVAVRRREGNFYHVDSNGVLTFRIIQTPVDFVGRPDWFLPRYDDVGRDGQSKAIGRFERDGVVLPKHAAGPYLSIEADCPGVGPYCSGIAADYDPDVCQFSDFEQTAYDTCCARSDSTRCVYANGQTTN